MEWRCQIHENKGRGGWVSMRGSFTKHLCVQLLGHQGFLLYQLTLPQLIPGELELEDRSAPNPKCYVYVESNKLCYQISGGFMEIIAFETSFDEKLIFFKGEEISCSRLRENFLLQEQEKHLE